jgi:hypothetical protein
MYSIPPVINGIPSTTNKGEFDAVNERTPRILIFPSVPGRSLDVISTPATLPCIACKASATGRDLISF